MKFSEFYKLIESAGWTIEKGKKHHKYVHPDFDYFIPVGRHPSKEVPKGTLDSMMKKAGLKHPPLWVHLIDNNIKRAIMKKIKAIIEKADDGGISIYSEDVNGAYGFGLTEQEAKEDFLSVLEEQAEYYKEKYSKYPTWYSTGYSIDYTYDISGFFEAFPFINASKFAKELGLNESVMRKYKGKIITASEKQRAIIQSKYDEILKRMELVKF